MRAIAFGGALASLPFALILSTTIARAGDTPYPTRPWNLTDATGYSDICLDAETGDVNGLRVFVRQPGQSPRIAAQYAEGGLEDPIAATTSIVRGRLRFKIPGDIPEATFVGEVRGQYLIVRSLQQGAKPFRLMRRHDTQGFRICR
jgi:hypothetical protein